MKTWLQRLDWRKLLSGAVIAAVLVVYLFPLYWMVATALKTRLDAFAIPPRYLFTPTLENFRSVFYDTYGTPTQYFVYFKNSIIIAALSTLWAVALGTLTAYGTSRFRLAGQDDILFFILSTRMLPPVATIIPLFLMFRTLNLVDTHLGMVLLYTMFNLGFAVWMMKGFIDEIPIEYEEAALVDGYTRMQAFRKIVLPQAATGVAATAVFSLIASWNEFVFASVMTTRYARTVPPAVSITLEAAGIKWGQIAASAFLFLLPVFVFTFLVRKSLLRGVTFGTIKR